VKNKQGVARPGGRASRLENIRKGKMARSPHAHVRGNTVRYYQWLERVERGAFPQGPEIWICGDCHVGNFGPVGNARAKSRFKFVILTRLSSEILRMTSFG
jgi:uncharacterized protein (DUF2252 family)